MPILPAASAWVAPATLTPDLPASIQADLQCYAIPYGGIGFASHIINVYLFLMVFPRRAPLWPSRLLVHYRFNAALWVVALAAPLVLNGWALAHCHFGWQVASLSVAKMMLTLCWNGVALLQFVNPKMREEGRRAAEAAAVGPAGNGEDEDAEARAILLLQRSRSPSPAPAAAPEPAPAPAPTPMHLQAPMQTLPPIPTRAPRTREAPRLRPLPIRTPSGTVYSARRKARTRPMSVPPPYDDNGASSTPFPAPVPENGDSNNNAALEEIPPPPFPQDPGEPPPPYTPYAWMVRQLPQRLPPPPAPVVVVVRDTAAQDDVPDRPTLEQDRLSSLIGALLVALFNIAFLAAGLAGTISLAILRGGSTMAAISIVFGLLMAPLLGKMLATLVTSWVNSCRAGAGSQTSASRGDATALAKALVPEPAVVWGMFLGGVAMMYADWVLGAAAGSIAGFPPGGEVAVRYWLYFSLAKLPLFAL